MRIEDKNVPAKSRSFDALDAFSWLCALFAFLPFVLWIAKEVSTNRQLSDALVILVCMCLALAIEGGVKFRAPVIGKRVAFALASAYVLFAIAPFLNTLAVFAAFGGLAMFVAALGVACLDKSRLVWAMSAAFYAFTLLALFSGAFDFPLRCWAGEFSTSILHLFNSSASLVTLANQPPQIGMIVEGQTYLVATECNGFGLISSCALLSVLFAFFRRGMKFFARLCLLALCVLMAFVANALRIVSIVLVAPNFSRGDYMIIHEAFGYFFFALTLILVWSLWRRGVAKEN